MLFFILLFITQLVTGFYFFVNSLENIVTCTSAKAEKQNGIAYTQAQSKAL